MPSATPTTAATIEATATETLKFLLPSDPIGFFSSLVSSSFFLSSGFFGVSAVVGVVVLPEVAPFVVRSLVFSEEAAKARLRRRREKIKIKRCLFIYDFVSGCPSWLMDLVDN